MDLRSVGWGTWTPTRVAQSQRLQGGDAVSAAIVDQHTGTGNVAKGVAKG